MPKHFTNTITIWNYGNDARNICDFSLVSKVCREFDDVTSAGKLFTTKTTLFENYLTLIQTIKLTHYFLLLCLVANDFYPLSFIKYI